MDAARRQWPTKAFGLLAVAAAYVVMAARTWNTWPDPLVDFGSQLYYPWRIVAGQHLYTDIAYFNGPLSQYLNAAAFAAFGVGLRTLVWVNLTILAGVLLLVRSLAGSAAAVVVAAVFAFGQYVGLGNYNWVCPYTHEVTHGVALGLAAVTAVARWQRGGRERWLVVAGVAGGLCFLTKAEVFVPAAAAVAVGLFAVPNPVGRPRRVLCVVTPAAAVVLVAFALLAPSIGPATAARAVAGSWPWVFDRRVAAIPFYRQGVGLDDVPGNVAALAGWLAAYAVVAAAVWLLADRRWRVVGGVAAAVVAVVGAVNADRLVDCARPWPVLVAGVAAVALWLARRAPPADRPAWARRAAAATLALGLMAKMALNARVYQYGFALAMPAAAVLVDAAVTWLPAAAARRGSAAIARVAAGTCVVAVVAVFVRLDGLRVRDKTAVVGTGADAFLADPDRGRIADESARAVADLLPDGGSAAVVPQGLIVNYLARRVDPVAAVNLMPPEVLSVGEANVLASLRRHPPDAVILTADGVDGDALLLTEGHFLYGRDVVAWVRANYVPDDRRRLPGGWTLLRRR